MNIRRALDSKNREGYKLTSQDLVMFIQNLPKPKVIEEFQNTDLLKWLFVGDWELDVFNALVGIVGRDRFALKLIWQNEFKSTPLHYFARYTSLTNGLAIIKFLQTYFNQSLNKASLIQDDKGNTPLHRLITRKENTLVLDWMRELEKPTRSSLYTLTNFNGVNLLMLALDTDDATLRGFLEIIISKGELIKSARGDLLLLAEILKNKPDIFKLYLSVVSPSSINLELCTHGQELMVKIINYYPALLSTILEKGRPDYVMPAIALQLPRVVSRQSAETFGNYYLSHSANEPKNLFSAIEWFLKVYDQYKYANDKYAFIERVFNHPTFYQLDDVTTAQIAALKQNLFADIAYSSAMNELNISNIALAPEADPMVMKALETLREAALLNHPVALYQMGLHELESKGDQESSVMHALDNWQKALCLIRTSLVKTMPMRPSKASLQQISETINQQLFTLLADLKLPKQVKQRAAELLCTHYDLTKLKDAALQKVAPYHDNAQALIHERKANGGFFASVFNLFSAQKPAPVVGGKELRVAAPRTLTT